MSKYANVSPGELIKDAAGVEFYTEAGGIQHLLSCVHAASCDSFMYRLPWQCHDNENVSGAAKLLDEQIATLTAAGRHTLANLKTIAMINQVVEANSRRKSSSLLADNLFVSLSMVLYKLSGMRPASGP